MAALKGARASALSQEPTRTIPVRGTGTAVGATVGTTAGAVVGAATTGAVVGTTGTAVGAGVVVPQAERTMLAITTIERTKISFFIYSSNQNVGYYQNTENSLDGILAVCEAIAPNGRVVFASRAAAVSETQAALTS